MAVAAISVDLRANAAAFARDMRVASSALGSSSAKMNRHLAKIDDGFNKMSKGLGRSLKGLVSFRGALATVVGGAGIGLLIKRSLDAADAIAKTSDRIGIASGALQEYRHAANLAGVSQEKLDSGLEAFAKRLGETRAGTGTLITILRKMDATLLDNLVSASSTEVALQHLFRGMDKLTSAADRAALGAAAFGRAAGVGMTLLIKDGTAALEAMRREARELGIVIDDKLLRGAEEAKDKLETLGDVISAQVTEAVIAHAAEIANAASKLTEWGLALGKFIGLFDDRPEQRIADLTARIGELSERLAVDHPSIPAGVIEGRIAQLAAERQALAHVVLTQQPAAVRRGAAQSAVNPAIVEGATRALERYGKAQDAVAASIRRNIEGPLEVMNRKIATATTLWREGRLSQDEHTRAVGKARAAYVTSGAAVSTLSKHYDDHILRLVRSAEATRALRERQAALAETIRQEVATPLERYNDALATAQRLLDVGEISQETFNRKVGALRDELAAATEATDKAASSAERFGEVVRGAMQSAGASIQRNLSSTLEGLFTGKLDSARSFFDSLKDLAVRAFADIAAAALAQQIILPVVISAAGAIGLGGLFGGSGGSGGVGGALNAAGTASSIGNLFGVNPFGGIASKIGGFLGLGGPAAFVSPHMFGAAGAAAGSAGFLGLGAVGGPLALAGLALGGVGLLGGLFGGKGPTPTSFGYLGLRDGDVFQSLISGGKGGAGDTGLASKVSNALAQLLSGLKGAGKVQGFQTQPAPWMVGDRTAAGVGFREGAGFFTGLFGGGSAPFFATPDEAIFTEAKAFLKRFATGPIDPALEFLKGQTSVEAAVAALGTEAGAVAALPGFNRAVELAILQITDPLQAALEQQADVARERLAIAEEMGANLVEVERLNALERAAVLEQVGTAALETQLAQQAGTVRGFFQGLLGPLEAFARQLSFGDLAIASPGERLSAARAEFEGIAAGAGRGERAAIDLLPTVGQGLLGASRDVFASGPEFAADFRRVNEVLNSVLAQQRDLEATLAVDLDLTLRETTEEQVAVLREEGEATRRELRELKRAFENAA